MSATEILPGLWLGDLTGAHYFQGAHLNVRRQPAPYLCASLNDAHIPVEYGAVTKESLLESQAWISKQFHNGRPAIVHCSGGLHRSPVAVAWFLHREKAFPTVARALIFIKSRRPEVEPRDKWISAAIHREVCGEGCPEAKGGGE